MSSVQTSAWSTCMSSEYYHLWSLALSFCYIPPDDESGRNGKCRWQLPLANWQHSAKYISSGSGNGCAATCSRRPYVVGPARSDRVVPSSVLLPPPLYSSNISANVVCYDLMPSSVDCTFSSLTRRRGVAHDPNTNPSAAVV